MTKARDIANAGTAFTTVTPTELGYVDGVTSAIQTQINTKQAVVSGVNDTEIGYLDGVTSAIQTQLDARIPASIATTKGDIIVATGSATLVRQGVGANGTVLTANSAQADGVEWATPSSGSETLITSGTLGGNNQTTISSISQAYTHLRLVILNYTISSRGAIELRLNSTNNVYGWAATNSTGSAVNWSGSGGNAGYFGLVDSAISTGTNFNSLICDIFYYTDTTANKLISGTYSQFDDPNYKSGNRSGTARIQSAINAIAIKGESTSTLTGNWYLYGVK